MKQIQFAVVQLSDANPSAVRAEVEGPLNNGWTLESWKPVGVVTRDEFSNLPVVPLVVCLTRELPDVEVAEVVDDNVPVRKVWKGRKTEPAAENA